MTIIKPLFSLKNLSTVLPTYLKGVGVSRISMTSATTDMKISAWNPVLLGQYQNCHCSEITRKLLSDSCHKFVDTKNASITISINCVSQLSTHDECKVSGVLYSNVRVSFTTSECRFVCAYVLQRILHTFHYKILREKLEGLSKKKCKPLRI